jgi:outer membrane protein
MKKIAALFAIVALFASFVATADTKIGVVDVQTIFQKSQTVAKMRSSLQSQFAPKEKAIKNKQKQLQDNISKYKRDSAIMKDSDRDALEKKISAEQQELGKMQSDFQSQIVAAQNKDMQTVMDKVQKAVTKIAKDQKLTLVLAKVGVIYADATVVDITEQALKIVG